MILPYENQVLREGPDDAPTRLLRVLWHAPDRRNLVLFDIEDPLGLPFWMSAVELGKQFEQENLVACAEDPRAASIRLDSDLTSGEILIRDRRHEYIKPLIEDPDRAMLDGYRRSKAMTAHVAGRGGSVKTAYHLLRLWWRFGQLPNALVPSYSASARTRRTPRIGEAKRGRPRAGSDAIGLAGINVTPEIAARMAASGRRLLKEGKPVRKAWVETLLEQFSDQVVEDGRRRNVIRPDGEVPSIDQFIYHVVRKFGRGDILLAAKGETRFARKNRPRTGTMKDVPSGPGSDYQIDATVGDIYLRSSDDPGRLIGRPVIYIVIDVYSRMIVGFCVALSGPSWEVAKLALENAMTEKVSFCASYGVHIKPEDWPSEHLCARLTCDRGSEVKGKNSVAGANGLGYRLGNLPPYRPDWKGLVESRFALINDLEIKWAPGASHGRERGEPKRKLDAVYTLRTFTELMINFVLHYNASFVVKDPPSAYVSPDGRAPTPIDLWNHGFRTCGAPQVADRDRVRANLLHVETATETDKGLRFAGLRYQPSDPDKAGMFRRVPGRTWRTHGIRFDPRDVSTILLPLDRGARFEMCHLTPRDRKYEGWTLDEVRDARAREREGTRLAAPDRNRAASEHQARMADLNRRAMAETDGVALTPKSASGIREERRAVNRVFRAEGAWTKRTAPEEAPVPAPPPPTAVEPGPPAAPQAVPGPSQPTRMDMLRAAREAERRRMEDSK